MVSAALAQTAHSFEALLVGHTMRSDRRILLALRRPGHASVPIGPAWLERTAIDISRLGAFPLLWIVAFGVIAFLTLARRRLEAFSVLVALAGSSVLDLALKRLFHRPRPELVPHLVRVTGTSFPSGHATVSAAVYLTSGLMLAQTESLASLRTAVVAMATVLVCLIGCTRVYLGVHWPSDVVVGWCVGSIWALLSFEVTRTLQQRGDVLPAA
jgi:undecaprenyl-diphosphatase